MKTVYDVRQLLKRFGTIIYIGNRLAELSLMEAEIKELYQTQCIRAKEYQQAMMILRKESANLRQKEEEGNKHE